MGRPFCYARVLVNPTRSYSISVIERLDQTLKRK